MGLPEPVAREPFHQRRIAIEGYRRVDGLWDIEAHMVDTKSYAFENSFRGTIHPGEGLHDMWLRVTIDEKFVVRDVVAVIDQHPFRICPQITGNFKKLIGETIKPGWFARVRELLGGTEGCTHLVELLGPIGTVAFQTLYSAKAREARASSETGGERPARRGRPALIDTCHAWAADGEAVKQHWPQFYTGPA
jgi:hypothetical protein